MSHPLLLTFECRLSLINAVIYRINAIQLVLGNTHPAPHRCIVCLFPAASVIISLGFTIVYLIALWVVTSRLAATVINRRARSVECS